MSHPNIDTREISCPSWARLSAPADHQPWPPRGEVPKRNWGPWPYLLTLCLSPRAWPRQDKETRERLHVSTPDPRQASRWLPTTKPERAWDFLETSWNCSEQREKKQPDSRGIHYARGRGSKKPLIVYKLHRFTKNRMLSRERGKNLPGQLQDSTRG